jgi:hypothetical protein
MASKAEWKREWVSLGIEVSPVEVNTEVMLALAVLYRYLV